MEIATMYIHWRKGEKQGWKEGGGREGGREERVEGAGGESQSALAPYLIYRRIRLSGAHSLFSAHPAY